MTLGGGWSCHVCGAVRPDAAISVHHMDLSGDGVTMSANVRHCNDNPDCIAGAPRVPWVALLASIRRV